MKHNPNYRKGTYRDSTGQMHKFVRSHKQDCSKCSRPDECKSTHLCYCRPCFDPHIAWGIGNFVEKPCKERKRFERMLERLRNGDEVKIKGAEKSGYMNGYIDKNDITHILCPYTKKWISRYKGE